MKRNIILFGCIICCLILVSLSYQPIIAEKPIEQITQQVKESKNDCGCNDESSRWGFPIICSVLGVFLLIFMILVISMNQNQFLDVLEFVRSIGTSLNCW
jgi:hypothetical protein